METTTQNNSQVRHNQVVGSISVSRVYASEYQKEGALTAELKQTIETQSFYPSKSVSNSLNANIFSTQDFGFEEKQFDSSETRVAWIDVPMGSTPETVMAKLQSIPDATLYKILSNRPILSDSDVYAVNSSELQVTNDSIANRQAIRYGANHPDAGKLVLDVNGKIQYRRVCFSLTKMEDQDKRTADPADFYASPELQSELNEVVHVIAEQSL